MSMTRRQLLGVSVLLAAPGLALAQGSYPTRSVRIIVPFAPGGAADITSRLLAERLQPILGQTFLVDNRGGAGGNIGADVVAKTEPDGHTILLSTAALLAANKFLYRRSMPFDPERDLAHVTRVSTGTVLLVVNADRPWRTFADLVAAAKAAPGRISLGSSGTGTTSHLTLSSINRAAGMDIAHIPYRGGGPAITDLLAGTIDMMFDVIPALMPHVRSGRFRPLAVGSAERITYVPELRDVPGMKEVLPQANIDMQSWYSISAPARTPAPVIQRLHEALVQVVRSDEFKARLEPMGFTTVWDESPSAFTQYVKEQEKVWQGLVEASGASLD
nr:tripartite tricarboxylate transporter substrate binding protein [Roseococcus sp. MDT2-1-1]